MIRRHLEATLLDSLSHFPAVLLVGARQVGKSTLVQAIANEAWPARYLTLDDRTVLDAALTDPDGFVRAAGSPVVVDEVQRAPDLLRAIKLEIDRNRKPGRYLLTGSANVLTLANVSETLAGRVAVHELRPFSFGELCEKPVAPVIERIFEAESASDVVAQFVQRPLRHELDEIRRFIVSGGFPTPALMESERARHTWFDSFRQTYVERDLRDIANIANLPDFNRLMTTMALRTAQLMNVSELSRDIGLPATTLRRYLHLLMQTFQIEILPPYSSNVGKRLVRTPKVYLTDSGSACYLCAAEDWRSLERRNLVGPLVETWAHAELRKLLALESTHMELTFWRTSSGQEVDFLVERGGQVVGVEAKWSGTLDKRHLAGLRGCREALRDRWHLGVLLYGGTEVLALDDRTLALPLGTFFG